MVGLSFFGHSISDIKQWVTLATYFRHYFFFIASVKLQQTLRLLQKLLLYYYYSNVFRQTQQKNHSWKLWNTKLKKLFLTVYEIINWDASFYSASQFLNNFPDLPRFTSWVFSIDHWNMTALFVDNIQVVLNKWPLLKVGNYSLASNNLQITPHAFFTLVVYPLIFVASIECSDSTTLTGKNTYCTTF